MFQQDEIVASYTRKEAIEDGVLIDVSAWAKEAGFTINTCITAGVFGKLDVTEEDQACGQSIRGRTWDVLQNLRWYIKHRKKEEDTVLPFHVLICRGRRTVKEEFKSIIGPGDTGEPVITILLPEED